MGVICEGKTTWAPSPHFLLYYDQFMTNELQRASVTWSSSSTRENLITRAEYECSKTSQRFEKHQIDSRVWILLSRAFGYCDPNTRDIARLEKSVKQTVTIVR